VRGFKSHPSSQAFEPDDARYYPLDFPVITPDRSLSDFAQLDVKDEVRPLILKDNAARMLRLGSTRRCACAGRYPRRARLADRSPRRAGPRW
jgi:Amidohydrolase